MEAELDLSHVIDYIPKREDAGTFKVYASISMSGSFQSTPSFLFSWKVFQSLDEFVCGLRKLKDLLIEAGITGRFADYANSRLSGLFYHSTWFPAGAISVYMYFDVISPQIEAAIQASLDDETTNNIRFRPASKLAVGSLSRKVYKTSKETSFNSDFICTICLEEFKNGARLVTLPCGHEFDYRCIVEWFGTSHVCPLCRFELPCENMN